jgi:hypothetical protein
MDAWRDRFGVGADDALPFVEAALRVARHRLAAGLDDRAGDALAQVEAVVREHAEAADGLPPHAAEAHRLRALLAARRGDDVRAAEEAERARSAGEGWHELLAAADGMRAAWRAARSGGAESLSRATRHRDRAIELHRAAIDALRGSASSSPDEPSVAVALGQASVRLAELLLDRGEEVAARDLLDEALTSLASMRDEVHANCWDEALYREGMAMARR